MPKMNGAMILAIEKAISHYEVINFLEKILDVSIFSDEYEKEKANLFLNFDEYEQGYRQSIFFSWSNDLNLKLDPYQIASAVAQEFNVCVLLRVEEDAIDYWPLFERNLPPRTVRVREVGDSIFVDNGTVEDI